MRILQRGSEPFHTISYSIGAAIHQPTAILPFYHATVDALPDGISAIIAAGDLQGVEQAEADGRQPRLLGEIIAAEIRFLRDREEIPAKEFTGIIVTGDLQPYADEADVTSVWKSLADMARWIAGVAGNHDAFGSGTTLSAAKSALRLSEMHFLDNEVVELDGMHVGGLSGIVGHPGGPWARSESVFAEAMANIANSGADVLISHDGPNVPGALLPGWPAVRLALESARKTLIIRGHDAWSTRLATLRNGSQVLNVEGSVIVLHK